MRRTALVAALLALVLLALTSPIDSRATASLTPSIPETGWVWPVDGARVVDRAFLAPAQPWAAGHRGVDLRAAAAGAEVRAATAGTVHFAGLVVDRPVITVRSGQLLVTVEPVTPLVAEGERVDAGQVIGIVLPGHCSAATTTAAPPCVHLGVRLAGEYVSPLLYLGGLRRAVLLPLESPSP